MSIVGLNAASYFLSAVFIYKLPSVQPDRQNEGKVQVKREFMEGLRYVIGRRELLAMRIVSMLFSLMVAPFFVVYIAVNDAWFGGKPQTLSWFEFSFFAGMILGSIIVGRRMPQRPGIANSMALAVVAFGVGVMAFSQNFWLFAFWNIVCGVAVPFADVTIQTYTSLTVPDNMRGRVNSLQMMTSTAMMPLGMALAGTLIDSAGIIAMFLVMGGGMFLACLIGLAFRDYRHARMPDVATA
jgi:predicted MFS family arabinose efflux permease